jgi:transposase InsO family protein
LLSPFRQVFPEITSLANGTLLMQDRIILPTSLHDKSVRLAHMGAHPGQNGLLRRLRSHFYITSLDEKVKKLVETCLDCQTFTTKRVREPIQPNKVPHKCWEEVSVDLFGPLPSSNHIVVVQDLASRFPVAKVVKSTSAKNVLPVLAETYNNFGNPNTQKSDNGPPFNSREMEEFTTKRDIEQVKIAPGHPAANNTLQSFLQTYRDTPHSATGIEPGNMIFRDGYRSNFPRKCLSEEQISRARQLDTDSKDARKDDYNSSAHTKPANFKIGDQVLVRNFYKRSKFEPYFLPERFLVVDTLAQGKILLVQSSRTGRHLKRHPNDLKLYEGEFCNEATLSGASEAELLEAWRQAFESLDGEHDYDDNSQVVAAPVADAAPEVAEAPLRRSERERVPNSRYYNNDTVNFISQRV